MFPVKTYVSRRAELRAKTGGGLILLPVLYEVALWLHRRRFARKLHQMAEEKKNAHHNRRAS